MWFQIFVCTWFGARIAIQIHARAMSGRLPRLKKNRAVPLSETVVNFDEPVLIIPVVPAKERFSPVLAPLTELMIVNNLI